MPLLRGLAAGLPGPQQTAPSALYHSGKEAKAAGRIEEARELWERAVELDPEYAPACLALGFLYLELSHTEEAEYCFQLARYHVGDSPDVLLALANLCVVERRCEEALEYLATARQLAPERVEVHALAASAYTALDRIEEALVAWERVLRLDPNHAEACNNLGRLYLLTRGQIKEARVFLLRALQSNPNLLEARLNLYQALADEGDIEGAIAGFDRLVDSPLREDALWHRAVASLKAGRFAEGWRDYGCRWNRPEMPRRPFAFPPWHGDSLNGKTLLVYAEQGLGDEIMFASCIPDLIRQAQGRIVLECNPKLERLLQRSFPAVEVIGMPRTLGTPAWLAERGPVDYQSAIGDLPGWFRPDGSSFPSHGGYLRPDSRRVEHWRGRLATLGEGPKIGISWRGGLARTRRDLRSIPLLEWLPLLTLAGIHFVSLQYTDCSQEITQLRECCGIRIQHWQEAIDDYDETAALVTALDGVISVCTAIVHLGGALGRPVWVLVPKISEWRYLATGECMPWYPSVRLFRQGKDEDWADVMDRVVARMREEGSFVVPLSPER
ncbi:MAG TPA: tetratricopeptide repeat protein [Methylococcus sp.]|nr:tetratricopeptide repeat protein [Methylococcus sp.]